MIINKIHFAYFSPTGTTKRVLEHMETALNTQSIWHDFTLYHTDYNSVQISSQEALVIGFPVYSGRVPITFTKRISQLKGNNTPAIIIATYGNRDYDDALMEMKHLLIEQGFVPISAAAFVTEHSMYRKLAAGRPDSKDLLEITQFASDVSQQIISIESIKGYNLHVKGNKNYREYLLMPMFPHSTPSCNQCGICAKLCPAGAIPLESPNQTDNELCIRCMACVQVCPVQARQLTDEQKYGAEQHLARFCERRNVNEIFLGNHTQNEM